MKFNFLTVFKKSQIYAIKAKLVVNIIQNMLKNFPYRIFFGSHSGDQIWFNAEVDGADANT
jgi:hypothetical protein